jgi:ppGpp synthetase/RelA/SpoT-type nucleotidyltranferase
MNSEEISREFIANEHLYKHLQTEALFILEQALERTEIKLHLISSRVKTLNSFLDKVQRKNLKKPFEEIRDVVGLRVVCLFLSDIERIRDLIRHSFLVLGEDNKIEGSDVSSFGYMSVHFIVTMKNEYVGPRYDAIADMPLEIQIRTMAMDAWANVSHYLDYKSDKDVPSDLKRDFYALSGLFYVADRHFEMFYRASKQSRKEMVELFEAGSSQAKAEQEINSDSLIAYLYTKFPNRGRSNAQDISELVSELFEAGYRKIGEIERTVDSALKAFLLFEKDNPPGGKKRKYTDVGAVRVCVQMMDEKFLQISNRAAYDIYKVEFDEEDYKSGLEYSRGMFDKYINQAKEQE